MEILVVLSLSSIIGGIIISSVLANQEVYYEDVVRTRIKSNIRSALDIISINIRQAGENLPQNFPAITLSAETSTESDILTLRRNLFSEILTICTDLTTSDTSVFVSNISAGQPECVAANVSSPHNVWDTYRTSEGGSIKAYIYDSLAKQGEFVDISSAGTSSGEFFFGISTTSRDYPALVSNIYLIEEFIFKRNIDEDIIEVSINDDELSSEAVAFSITGFDIALDMNDGTTIESLNTTSSYTWKDIRMILVNLEGEEARKEKTIGASLSGEYFPRNVLSY